MEIEYVVADPGGNITIFVLTPCARKDYPKVAQSLLELKALKGEQVGFIKSLGEVNKLEMCGLEFCGNAGRAFGLYVAKKQKLRGRQTIVIEESGSAEPLRVEVDVERSYTKIQMPLPLCVEAWQEQDLPNGTLVDLGGIVHIVLEGVEPSEKIYDRIRNTIYAKKRPPALGVMFYDRAKRFLTPVVYVESVATTYWEGSCGSGSLATALALSRTKVEGIYSYTFAQPAGAVTATIEKVEGKLSADYIEGEVVFGPEQKIELDI